MTKPLRKPRNINRRQFIIQTTATVLAASQSAVSLASGLDPSIIGSNTAFPGLGLFDAIRAVKELGFPAIEIHPFGSPEAMSGIFPGFQFDRLSTAEKDQIRQALMGFRHITTHLPFQEIHLFSRYVPIAEFSVQQLKSAMDATAFFGAELAVAHITAPSHQVTLDDIWPVIIRRFREWGDIAARGNFKITIETGYPNSINSFVRLIKEINHDAVGCTIDVGHQVGFSDFSARVKPADRGKPEAIVAYNDVIHAIIDQLGPKVFHFHVHDVDRKSWQDHRPLGAGVVDYPRLVRKLKQINYSGLLMFELGCPADRIREDLADSKSRLEKFLAEA